MVTRRTAQRSAGDRVLNAQAAMMRALEELRSAMPEIEVMEQRVRGSGNLPPATHTRPR